MKAACFLGAVLMMATAGWGAGQRPRLVLRVDDLTGIRTSDLAAAVRETARIFRATGIDLAWTEPDPAAPEARAVDGSTPGAPAASWTVVVAAIVKNGGTECPGEVLGRSLPFAVSGTEVTLFLDNIRSWAIKAGLTFPTGLGNALAHELGHVLLWSEAGDHHGPGLMRAQWGPVEFDRIRHGALKFSQAQSAAMRRRVTERPSDIRANFETQDRGVNHLEFVENLRTTANPDSPRRFCQ
jgi:hypothetical protein